MQKTCIKLRVLLSLGIFLQACSSSDDKLKVLRFREKVIATVETQHLKDFDGLSVTYQPPNREYVFVINLKDNVLFKLDLLKFSLSRIHAFPVKEVETFAIDDEQKQYSCVKNDTVYTYLFSGQLIAKHTIPTTKKGFLFFMQNAFEPLTADGKYYFNYFANLENSYLDSNFFKRPIECTWNPSTNAVTPLPAYYPKSYAQVCYGYNFLPRRIQLPDKRHAYFFDYCDSIYILDLKTNEVENHFVGTRRKKMFLTVAYHKAEQFNSSVFSKLFMDNPTYISPGYLSNQRVYYRVFFPKFGRKLTLKLKSTVLYDAQFTYLGESPLSLHGGTLHDTKQHILKLSMNKQREIVCTKLTY